MGQAQQKSRAVLIVEDDAELRGLTAALPSGPRSLKQLGLPPISFAGESVCLTLSEHAGRRDHERPPDALRFEFEGCPAPQRRRYDFGDHHLSETVGLKFSLQDRRIPPIRCEDVPGQDRRFRAAIES